MTVAASTSVPPAGQAAAGSPHPGRRLLVVLASPPLTSGARTRSQVQHAGRLLRCSEVRIGNLYAGAATDLPALSELASGVDGWLEARPPLLEGLRGVDAILVGWGLYELKGAARLHRREQIAWFCQAAAAAGHTSAWTVGGLPRHPSRWHQYTSDRHQRTSASSQQERLREVLVEAALEDLAT